MSPRIHRITPPFRFQNPQDHCEIILDVGANLANVRSTFKFIEIKRKAQDILQECEDEGPSQGGLAPIGTPHGWYVEVSRVVKVNVDANDPINSSPHNGSLLPSSSLNIPNNTPHEIECFGADQAACPVSIDDCRPVFRNIQRSTMKLSPPSFRTLQDFEAEVKPKLPGKPPIAFAGGPCLVGIRPGHDHYHVVGKFSFEQAKDVGYEILEYCKDRGGRGGRAPIGIPFGWVVNVFGTNLPRRLESNSTLQTSVERWDSVIEPSITKSIVNTTSSLGGGKEFYGGSKQLRTPEESYVTVRGQPKDEPNQNRGTEATVSSESASTNLSSLTYRVNCYDQQRNWKRITYDLCKPAINSIKTVMRDFNARQTFQFGRTPVVQVQGYPIHCPPFLFHRRDTDCLIRLDTYHRDEVDTFSWREVWQSAKDILNFCEDEQGEYFGGTRLVGSKQSWFVQIHGPINEQPSLLAVGGNGSLDAL